MEKHQNDEPAQLEKMRNQYVSLVDTVYTIMGDNAFFSLDKDRRRKFNGAVYDSIIIPFSYYPSKALLQHADDLRAQINLLKENNAEYKENTYAGTNSGTRVRGRIEQIKEIIDRIIAQDAAPSQKRCFDEDINKNCFILDINAVIVEIQSFRLICAKWITLFPSQKVEQQLLKTHSYCIEAAIVRKALHFPLLWMQ